MACDRCNRAFPMTDAGWIGASNDVVEPGIPGSRCVQVACMACGTVQCLSNGSARGTCGTCYRGMLPGWSGNARGQACSYKGCPEPAVYRDIGRGKARACKAHGDRILARQALRR